MFVSIRPANRLEKAQQYCLSEDLFWGNWYAAWTHWHLSLLTTYDQFGTGRSRAHATQQYLNNLVADRVAGLTELTRNA
jgi:hypothetical protein